MKQLVNNLLRVVVLLLILIGAYYIFFLIPKVQAAAKVKTFTEYHSNLVQNRISYVDLTKLKPNDSNVQSQKNALLLKISETQKQGVNFTDKRVKDIYERQSRLIEKLKNSKTFEEGINLLKGQESVVLLTDQTNLILELEFQLERLKAKR